MHVLERLILETIRPSSRGREADLERLILETIRPSSRGREAVLERLIPQGIYLREYALEKLAILLLEITWIARLIKGSVW